MGWQLSLVPFGQRGVPGTLSAGAGETVNASEAGGVGQSNSNFQISNDITLANSHAAGGSIMRGKNPGDQAGPGTQSGDSPRSKVTRSNVLKHRQKM
jgi:hypothetical protein